MADPVRAAAGASAWLPHDFAIPLELVTDVVLLRPLSISHNEADLAAWTASIPHIQETPGFADHPWPREPMTLEENAADLVAHEVEFAERRGFTYTVLDARTEDVIGCVYVYPPRTDGFDVYARSWVRADRAGLDRGLHGLVRWWLETDWPFRRIDYAPR